MQIGITDPSSSRERELGVKRTLQYVTILRQEQVILISRVSASVILPTVNLNVDLNTVLKQLQNPTTNSWNERTLEVMGPLHEKRLQEFECGVGINENRSCCFICAMNLVS